MSLTIGILTGLIVTTISCAEVTAGPLGFGWGGLVYSRSFGGQGSESYDFGLGADYSPFSYEGGEAGIGIEGEVYEVTHKTDFRFTDNDNQLRFNLRASSLWENAAAVPSLQNVLAGRTTGGLAIGRRDKLELQYLGTGPIPVNPLYDSVILNWVIEGKMEVSQGPAPFIGSAHVLSDVFVGFSVGPSKVNLFGETYGGEDSSASPIAVRYGAYVPLDEKLSTDDFALTVDIDWSIIWGVVTGRFGNTVELESITFADGSTPEEHGFEVVFGSGAPSPNVPVNAVPEPGSLILFALGATGIAVGCRRRPKKGTHFAA